MTLPKSLGCQCTLWRLFSIGRWIANFWGFARQRWADFDDKLSDGESLREVQRYNAAGLEQVLRQYPDKTVVIGTRGTILSTIINHYDTTYGFVDFQGMVDVTLWVIAMFFRERPVQGWLFYTIPDRIRFHSMLPVMFE